MAKTHGRVIETRGNFLVIRRGTDPSEYEHECHPSHGASPGDYVLIDEDGAVEITGRTPPEPENIPVPGPQQDHS